MAKDISRAVQHAAQQVYEARVEQATREFFECQEKPDRELGIDGSCEETFKEKLLAYFAEFQRAQQVAAEADSAQAHRPQCARVGERQSDAASPA